MAPPFQISCVQLTMEPVPFMLETARALDRNGFGTFWLGEAYPWWRKHGMEARSSTALSALIAHETERIKVGWGIISPYSRHPVQVAMEARVVQDLAPDRFVLGFGTSKIFLNNIARSGEPREAKPLAHARDSVSIVRGVLAGGRFRYDGRTYSADVPPLDPSADASRDPVPVYLAGTAPLMQQLAGEIADGVLTPSITTPAFVRHTRENIARGAARAGRDAANLDIGCTIVASIDHDRERGRAGAKEITAMYLANKVQNIKGAADTLLELAGIDPEEIAPVAEAMERGGRLAAADAMTDDLLDRAKPIAGTPGDCIAAIEEYRDAGCTNVMLELWGDDRHAQIELLGREVLPHFNGSAAG
jgi:5,10-methylenetetrahydromethanopterin reductase